VLRILSPLKSIVHRPRPGLNPRTLSPVASTLTTRPPRTMQKKIVANVIKSHYVFKIWKNVVHHYTSISNTIFVGFEVLTAVSTKNFYQTTRRYNPEDSHLPNYNICFLYPCHVFFFWSQSQANKFNYLFRAVTYTVTK
jgi:hypothetical protein